jgi:hypothetical protein
MKPLTFIVIILSGIAVIAQDKDAYAAGDAKKGGLFDPSRFTVHNSISFGAASNAGIKGMETQSLYTTMMQYQFVAPVTLNLNFGLPIHSTFSSSQNLSVNNLQSLDYFKNMPIEMALSWQPTKNTFFQLSFVKQSRNYLSNYYGMYQQPWGQFGLFNNQP